MYSLNLHFDVQVGLVDDSNWRARIVPNFGGKTYEDAFGKDIEGTLNKLLALLKKKHPDVNIHFHLVVEPL
jgi:hypothetical protein